MKEEVIKLFLENFSTLALHPNHYGKMDLLELRIELQPGAVPKRSKVRPLNPDQRANLKEQLDPTRDYRTCQQSLGIATSSSEEEGREDEMGDRPEAAQ